MAVAAGERRTGRSRQGGGMDQHGHQSSQQARTTVFLWPTRQHLYEHFEMTYNMSREDIDKAVEDAKAHFRLRKGRPVEPQELWQKVGMALKRRLLRTG